MVNHLYTLLVNLPASDLLEFIDPSFSTLNLSKEQRAVRTQVFTNEYPQEYISFIARGVVRLCESSRLWPMFMALDARQPVWSSKETPQDILPSLHISIPSEFYQGEISNINVPYKNQGDQLNNSFLVNQQYIKNSIGQTIISCYGSYTGIPEMGIFSTDWNILKEGNNLRVQSQRNPINSILAPILVDPNDSSKFICTLGLPGENNLSLRIYGSSIPNGFYCSVNARNPMTYSFEDMYSRLASSTSTEIFANISDSELSNDLSSIFWSRESLCDSVASIMLAYVRSA